MAVYHRGKTIDPDEKDSFLKIEGERYPYKEEGGRCYYDYYHDDGYNDFCKDLSFSSEDICINKPVELGKIIIDKLPSTKTLEEQRTQHIKKLNEYVKNWNEWRTSEPYVRPILYGLNTTGDAKINDKNLQKVNFSNANLINADLTGYNLTKANFHEANLGGAKLTGADLTMANFCRADLYNTDLSGANLKGANLQGAQLAGTKFKKANGIEAKIVDCKVYGSSAWDIEGLDQSEQKNLEIVYKLQGETEESHLYVDDLGVAQFLYFILNNKNLSNVFKATNSSIVLILGRFTKDRKKVLDNIRARLRNKTSKMSYVPIIFDFEKPEDRGYTEVITVLAGISRFIIADLTNPKSIPQELQAIITGFRTPVIPIINRPDIIPISNFISIDNVSSNSETEAYSMFADYYKYDWVHPVIEYSSEHVLLNRFDKLIYAAEEFHAQIMATRVGKINRVSIDDL